MCIRDRDGVLTAAIISIKTTGLDYEVDEIIELSCIKCLVNPSGKVIKIIQEVDQLQQPRAPLSEQVKEMTFLNDEDLSGKIIDWTEIQCLLNDTDVIISFNAQFERPFLENKIKHHNKKWACAYAQIPWSEFGYPKKSLELLCIQHNFYYEESPGIERCRALINLLEKKIPSENKLYLKILLDSLSEKSYLLIALKSSFSAKWFFNQHKFSFNYPLKMWFKFFNERSKDEAELILEEMKANVYEGIAFNGCLIEIDATKKFKSLNEFANLSGNEKIFTKEPPGKYTKPFMLIAKNIDGSHSNELNARLYSWIMNGKKQEWVIYVTEEEANHEKKWLVENIYKSHFKGTMVSNKDFKP